MIHKFDVHALLLLLQIDYSRQFWIRSNGMLKQNFLVICTIYIFFFIALMCCHLDVVLFFQCLREKNLIFNTPSNQEFMCVLPVLRKSNLLFLPINDCIYVHHSFIYFMYVCACVFAAVRTVELCG
jgi:hypothetical protein